MAFSLPALAHITESVDKEVKEGQKPSILVVAPTRELALQTQETMEQVGAPFGVKSVCVFGGVDKGPQKKALSSKKCRVVVGTPGRLLDLVNEGACDLSRYVCQAPPHVKLMVCLQSVFPCARRGRPNAGQGFRERYSRYHLTNNGRPESSDSNVYILLPQLVLYRHLIGL